MNVLLTGGAGFIGHHMAEHLLRNTDCNIIFLDRLDFSGNLNRITEIKDWEINKKRCKWIYHDLKAPINSQLRGQIGKVDVIIHMAASTHVDRSIADPMSFVMDNVVGTANILEYAREIEVSKFINFGTDEVFGPALDGEIFKEWDRYKSGNPYSATKAGAEELCLAYHNTYKLPVIAVHCMNAFGHRQNPEKYVPKTIANVRDLKEVIVHASPDCKTAGSRFYIHARNIADAVLFLMDKGEYGDKYNIVGEKEVDNLTLAKMIADFQGKPLVYKMVDFHSSRKGHDLRYAISGEKIKDMGWEPKVSFEQSLESVVRWTLDNPRWLLA